MGKYVIEDKVAFGIKIRALRTEKDWTQKELGEKIGRGQPIVGKWEAGEHAPPDESIESLANVLGVEPAWLCQAPDNSDVKKPEYNPMLESAKQVLRMHGYEAVPAEEYHVWAKVKKLYAPGPGANVSSRAKVLRNFESGGGEFQCTHTSPTFTPDRNAGHKAEVIAEAADINWGPLMAVGYGADHAASPAPERRPDDDHGGKLALVAR